MIDLDGIRKHLDSLEEASTVLDESYHREAICNAMLVSAREGRALLAYIDELQRANEALRAAAEKACETQAVHWDTIEKMAAHLDAVRALRAILQDAPQCNHGGAVYDGSFGPARCGMCGNWIPATPPTHPQSAPARESGSTPPA